MCLLDVATVFKTPQENGCGFKMATRSATSTRWAVIVTSLAALFSKRAADAEWAQEDKPCCGVTVRDRCWPVKYQCWGRGAGGGDGQSFVGLLHRGNALLNTLNTAKNRQNTGGLCGMQHKETSCLFSAARQQQRDSGRNNSTDTWTVLEKWKWKKKKICEKETWDNNRMMILGYCKCKSWKIIRSFIIVFMSKV